MARLHFYSNGKKLSLSVQLAETFLTAPARAAARKRGGRSRRSSRVVQASKRIQAFTDSALGLIHAQRSRLDDLFHDGVASLHETTTLAVKPAGEVMVVPTQTIVVEGPTKTELRRLRGEHGMEIVREGSHGKVLLRAPEGGEKGVRQAFDAALACFERGKVVAAHPNFLRMVRNPSPSTPGGEPLWNHHNDGNPGIPGADVAARAVWTITRGTAAVRVAVLDEGVDTNHPALKPTVVAQRDFVDGNTHARPDGDDAHGTACAGIIVSRNASTPGLASECSLVAVRIAKGDGQDGWVFDDFNTADAIDWSWDQAKADVLSNSWGGGPPVDVITRAFERARTRGRNGKGCIVTVAAGNSNGPVQYPATLAGVLAVGASNPWDERKSPTSRDGENWWGSCFGRQLALVAPGVKIATTDIRGTAGYSDGSFITNFNGTSSACPHVAAAAALVLSVKPNLSEQRVRETILKGVDRISASGRRTNELGEGRLNLFQTIRLARR